MLCPGAGRRNRYQWPQWQNGHYLSTKTVPSQKNANAIEATARRLGRLSVCRPSDRRPSCGQQDRNCVGVRPTAKKSSVVGLQFSISWSQRSSRRASEAITPSALSPPDMTKDTEAGEKRRGLHVSNWCSLWTSKSPDPHVLGNLNAIQIIACRACYLVSSSHTVAELAKPGRSKVQFRSL